MPPSKKVAFSMQELLNAIKLVDDDPTSSMPHIPAEILTQIFLYAALADPQNPHNPSATVRAISQVNQYWRNVILNLPTAWASSFDMAGTAEYITDVILPRCRDLPLGAIIFPPIGATLMGDEEMQTIGRKKNTTPIFDVMDVYDLPMEDFQQKFEDIIPDLLKRTRAIVVKLSTQQWEEELDKFVLQDLKSLESLAFVRGESDDEEADSWGLFDEILAEATTTWNLRSLHLRRCNFYLHSQAFAALEELILWNPPSSSSVKTTEILEIIAFMNNLESLVLMRATYTIEYRVYGEHAEDFAYSTRNGAIVSLPHLQHFHFDGPAKHCAELLAFLHVPKTCNFELKCHHIQSVSSLVDPYRCVIAEFSSARDNPKFARFGKAVEVRVEAGQLTLETVKPPVSNNDMSDGCASAASFTLLASWDSVPGYHFEEVLKTTVEEFGDAFKDVTELYLTYSMALDQVRDESIVFKLLDKFPNLRHLHIPCRASFEFLLPYLIQPMKICTSSDLPLSFVDGVIVGRGPLESLTTITINKVDFKSPASITFGDSFYEILLTYAKTRRTRITSRIIFGDGVTGLTEANVERLRSCCTLVLLPERFHFDSEKYINHL